MRRPSSASRTAAALSCLLALCLAGVALAENHAAEDEETGVAGPLAATLLILVFLSLLVLPFAPATAEVIHPLDEYPLRVNLDYSKNPRYLGKSAWAIVNRALGDLRDVDGPHTAQMSKPETIVVSHTRALIRGSKIEDVLYVNGELTLEHEAHCENDVYVTGGAQAASGCEIRTLACGGHLELGARCRLGRWIDAEGQVDVGEQCVLGAIVSSGAGIALARGVRFKRLWGNPVATHGASDQPVQAAVPTRSAPRDEKRVENIEDAVDWHRDSLEIDPGEVVEGPLVVKKDLTLGEAAVLKRTAKVYGKIEVGPGATVHGDLFCEGPITIGEGAVIAGNVFSQDSVEIRRGGSVGLSGRPKSLIAKKSIRLAEGVRIHGYVLTEGEGLVV